MFAESTRVGIVLLVFGVTIGMSSERSGSLPSPSLLALMPFPLPAALVLALALLAMVPVEFLVKILSFIYKKNIYKIK